MHSVNQSQQILKRVKFSNRLYLIIEVMSHQIIQRPTLPQTSLYLRIPIYRMYQRTTSQK